MTRLAKRRMTDPLQAMNMLHVNYDSCTDRLADTLCVASDTSGDLSLLCRCRVSDLGRSSKLPAAATPTVSCQGRLGCNRRRRHRADIIAKHALCSFGRLLNLLR